MSREVDAKVAELVMGWGWFLIHSGGFAYLCDPKSDGLTGFINGQDKPAPVGTERLDDVETSFPFLPEFTTDPTADYAVLVRVRETWDYAARERMDTELARVWDARGLEHLAYEPGDFSKAALAALAERTP